MLRSLLFVFVVSMVALLPGEAHSETAAAGAAAEATAAESPAAEATAAPRPGRNCLGEARPKLLMSQVIGVKWGPWGLEHQLRIGACVPLVPKPGVLFDFSFLAAGFQAHTSPIYVMPGFYIDIAPLSILQFHFQFAPVFYWSIPLNGAGYYALDSYQQDYTETLLVPEDGESALGWYLRTGMTLQFAVPIGPVRLLVSDSLLFEHWQLGEQSYYFHNRNDIPAARREWFIDNMALLLAEFAVHRNVDLRVGINHQLTMNLGARQMSNFFGGVAMVRFKRLGPAVHDFMPLVRIGVRPQHPVRQGHLTFIIGLMFNADLLAHRSRGEAAESGSLRGSGVAGEDPGQGLWTWP